MSLEKVQDQTHNVTTLIKENIRDMASQLETTQSLEKKSETIKESSDVFKKSSEDLKYDICNRQFKITAGLTGILGMIVFIILSPIISRR